MEKNVVVLFYPSAWPEGARGRIPYALLYLERMVRDLGLEIVLIDEQVQRAYHSVLENVKERLLLVAVSAMTGDQIVGGVRFSKSVREVSDCPIIWGGWHPTLLPEQTLREAYVDIVVIGQGEYAFQNLVKRIQCGAEIQGIPGVGYKREGECVVTPPAQFVDINEFPRNDHRLLDVNNYVFKSSYAERCVGYFCSHGCPHHCAFCCVATIYGRKWYNKGVDEIIEDLRYFKESAEIDSVTFDDDNFFVNREFALEFSKKMIESKLGLLWDTSAHAATFLKNFSDDDVELFYRAGCRQIYVGAESGDQDILDLISKGTTVDDNLKFVKLLKRHKIIPMLSTMVCFPVDSGEDVDQTIDMVRRAKLLDPNLRARIFFYTPYPGTELYDKAIAAGFKPPARLEDWPSHTLRKFKAPWTQKDFRWAMEVFANFYFPLCNPRFYESIPIAKLKPLLFVINKVFFPIAFLRFKYNYFRLPFEAKMFLKCLQFYNKVMNKNYSLGFESYLD